MLTVKENILLSELTTIKLGGNAAQFCECNTENEIIECIIYAKDNNLRLFVLGGGSNVIFPDNGFDGLLLNPLVKGIKIHNDLKEHTVIKVGAGEKWDDFVNYCVDNNLTGVECLAGIPGTVGATPIQNVGAYGQEVSDTIIFVKAIDVKTLKITGIMSEDCLFSYRNSRFKSVDKGKYIITEVTFKLRKNGEPRIVYPELSKYIYENVPLNSINDNKEKLKAVKNCVLQLRKKKSMVVDPCDVDSVSCGSFFTNPVISRDEFSKLTANANIDIKDIPHFDVDGGVKIPAAFLIENAGFNKGYKRNGVGISNKHTLALVNYNGTSKDLLKLADEIREKVFEKFGIRLIIEPEVVSV